jgi:hypothetical protein
MKTFTNRAAFAFMLAALAAMLNTAPAQAMGRSGSQAATTWSSAQPSDRRAQEEAGGQIQLDALRKEMAELKARLATASAK